MIAGFSPRVAVLAFDGVVLSDLAIPSDVFGMAGYEVRVCSEAPQVECNHATLSPPWRLESLRRSHTVIVPGTDDLTREVSPAAVRAIRAAAQRGARVASVCTGAFVLAQTGLLDGLRATTHWRAAATLAARHPAIEVDPSVLYVDNGSILTSAGAAAALDLCLHMIRRDRGAEAAAAAARASVMPLEREGGQAQFIEHAIPKPDSLIETMTWLELHLDRELPLSVIARQAGMSPRTLSRRFREQVGTTPAKWLAHARVRRAQRLLETTSQRIEDVAAATGFGSAAVLRDNFARIVGTSPRGYRRAFIQQDEL